MAYKETDDLYELAFVIEDVLKLDDEELKRMMKETPDEVITIIRHGFSAFHTVLTEILIKDNL